MAKVTTKAEPKAEGLTLLTLLMTDSEREALDLDDDCIIHEQSVDLDEPNLSGSGNSFKLADATVNGEDAPTATARIDGVVVKAPMTIRTMAYISVKAVDKARGRKAK